MPSLTTHNTPALRFPGYTGVWEQRPQLRFKNKNGEDYPKWEKDILDNVGTFIKGAPLSKNDISENGTPFILYGELYTTYNEITKHVVRRTKTDVADRYYSIAGDVVIPTSGETPDEISTATCVMKDGVILAGDLLIYRTIDTIDGRMMSYIINHQINNDISRIAQGKSVVHIQAKELGQITFECPSLAEQQKIADFFSKLDDLLALHQRQTQKLKKLKQGLLQNMFPREGESVPRLRFPGFTTHWKQQKLGDIYNFHYGEFNNNPDNNGPYPVYGANGIIGGYTKFNAEDSSIIGHIGAAGYVKWGMGKHFVTYNGTIAKPAASSLDSKFGYYALSNKKIYKICAGSGRPFVSYADLNSIDMRIPNDLLEQKKISLLFTRLDDLLALHEQYTVKLTQLKKGLLQKMFPQD